MYDSIQLTPKKLHSSPGSKPKPILRTKSYAHQIIVNGKDMTPKTLNPDFFRAKAHRSHSSVSKGSSATVNTELAHSEGPMKSILRFRSDIELTTVQGSFYGAGSSLDMFQAIQGSSIKDDQSDDLTGYEEDAEIVDADTTRKMRKAPTHISLTLSETNTFFVLDIPSCIEIRNTEEGDEAERENEEYLYLTEGKGRNRKVVDAEAQTAVILKKSRNTEAEIISTKNARAFASNWEMHDTYHGKARKQVESSSSNDSDGDEDLKTLTSDALSAESIQTGIDEKQLLKIFKNSRFQEAVCIMERLLANNLYNEQQKRFSGLSDPDMFREDIQYKYRLELLWTFSNTTTKGKGNNIIIKFVRLSRSRFIDKVFSFGLTCRHKLEFLPDVSLARVASISRGASMSDSGSRLTRSRPQVVVMCMGGCVGLREFLCTQWDLSCVLENRVPYLVKFKCFFFPVEVLRMFVDFYSFS
ncbi:unnamed protein product [Ceutorhynchus assimilis]|uniref:Uncharacterized protein n=1 Tax=Ceutorhynchus assimilis TaxID=467358 RepID=A0A9N9MJI9_9CUCU|nr:unnamed protein product [Ceutorhynchus assimilis]